MIIEDRSSKEEILAALVDLVLLSKTTMIVHRLNERSRCFGELRGVG
jgi:hypothetical protein